jgi:hypothetical protein
MGSVFKDLVVFTVIVVTGWGFGWRVIDATIKASGGF